MTTKVHSFLLIGLMMAWKMSAEHTHLEFIFCKGLTDICCSLYHCAIISEFAVIEKHQFSPGLMRSKALSKLSSSTSLITGIA
jgi:hypothetical protein